MSLVTVERRTDFNCSVHFQLSGSAGEFMPHDLTKESGLTLFVPDLCRTVLLQYTASGQLGGLPYYKYELTESSFDNCKFQICHRSAHIWISIWQTQSKSDQIITPSDVVLHMLSSSYNFFKIYSLSTLSLLYLHTGPDLDVWKLLDNKGVEASRTLVTFEINCSIFFQLSFSLNNHLQYQVTFNKQI